MSKIYDFKNKVAIVTGASRGIGKAIAAGLAAGGAKLVLTSRKEPELRAAADEIKRDGAEILVHPAHVGREEEIQRLVETAHSTFGRIDCLVNNAGTNPTMSMLLDTSVEVWDKIFGLNVRGYFLMSKFAVAHMTEGGAIVNVSSTAGLRPMPGLGVYSVSKAAVIHLTKTMAFELASRKIRVNAIAPGLIKTKLSSALWENEAIYSEVMKHTPLDRMGDPEEVAAAACYLLSSESAYITGHTLVLDGGATI
ncbi:MAG: SDR family oxidoreductase [Nitrospirae bacterium]|nr:SDR family oxidoreductase [Nitrospirota bacterium]